MYQAVFQRLVIKDLPDMPLQCGTVLKHRMYMCLLCVDTNLIQSDLPQSKLLLGARGDVQFATHMLFSKKSQQPLSVRSKHLMKLGCVVLQAELQA